MDRFSKFQRHMFTIDGMHMWKMLGLKIYFRFARENSKWPPKTTFSWITRELMDRISKFQRQMFTIDSMHTWKILLSNSTPGLLQKNSKLPPRTGFNSDDSRLYGFSNIERDILTKHSRMDIFRSKLNGHY